VKIKTFKNKRVKNERGERGERGEIEYRMHMVKSPK